jgi:putative RecB family exonuclease
MPFEPPRTLSPSKVAAFSSCALSFRFTAVEHLREAATPWTLKGTLVHTALERLVWDHPPGERSEETALAEVDRAADELRASGALAELGIDADADAAFVDDARRLVANARRLEDPDRIDVVGVELLLEATIGGVRVRGILDRLDRAEDGSLVVVDYKTGRAPAPAYERARLAGVHLYALLCELVLGERPSEVRLLHLREPTVIASSPTEPVLRAHERRTRAVWNAVTRACRSGDFRPRPSGLCGSCQFRSYCPAHGGDPSLAAVDLGAGRPEVGAA